MPEWLGTYAGPGLYGNIPEETYHKDVVPGGSLSVSGAKLLLPPNCPAIYDYRTSHPVHSKAMDLGSVVHGMILGTGPQVAVIDADDWRTKAAKDARAAAEAAGRIPLLYKDYVEADAIADAVRSHETAGALFDDGDPEVSMFWQCDTTGIWVRGRMDWWTRLGETPTIVDLKTTKDSSPASFAKSLHDYGYYLQAPWYTEGLAAAIGCDPLDIDFVFVTVPTSPPYLPMLYRLTASDEERGHLQGLKAREIYRDCAKTGTWPSWSDEIEDLPLPAYSRTRIDKELADHGYRISSTDDLPF